MRAHADDRAKADRDEVRGAGPLVAFLVTGWIVVLALYLRHEIVLSSDSVNNHVHVWYIARDLWHHGRLPWRMPELAHGNAYAYPYGFINWTTASLLWPLFGNWAVTAWTALGAVGCLAATFTAFAELRRGWWAAAVLANPAILEGLLFGQQSFLWGAMLLLFGVAAWRRGHYGWAALLVGLGQADHAAIVLPIGVLLVAGYSIVAPERRALLRWYALSCVIALPAVWLVFASPTTAETSVGAEISNFFITLGPRVLIVGLPVICVLLQRTGVRALAPVGIGLALIAHLGFEIPLNVGQQWQALVHNGTDTSTLDTYLRSPHFVAGKTYRVLRGGDAKLGMYRVLRAGGWLDSEMFPESMAIRNFHGTGDYAKLLCDRRVDQVIHDDTYDTMRRTNEEAMIAALEGGPVDGVRLRTIASGPGWHVDAVNRSRSAISTGTQAEVGPAPSPTRRSSSLLRRGRVFPPLTIDLTHRFARSNLAGTVREGCVPQSREGTGSDNWNGQVLQCRKGLRLHLARRRRQGRFRPLLQHSRQRVPHARGRPEGRVRRRTRTQGRRSAERSPGLMRVR